MNRTLGFDGLRLDTIFCSQFIQQGIGDSGTGKEHRAIGLVLNWRVTWTHQDFIGKAHVHRCMCVHPGLCIHKMRELGTAHAGFDFVGVDDTFLYLVQHGDGFLHLCGIAKSHSGRIVNHQHGHGRYQHLGTSHCNDRGCRSSNAVNLYCDVALVIHQHVVNLCCGYAVATRRVNPDSNVTTAGEQFIFEELWCDIIVKPAVLGDGAV